MNLEMIGWKMSFLLNISKIAHFVVDLELGVHHVAHEAPVLEE
jgi:hypothetical protein